MSRRRAAKLWNAIVVAGAGVSGCFIDVPGSARPDIAFNADMAVSFDPIVDMQPEPPPGCTPDMTGFHDSTDAFNPANGCLPGVAYENGDHCYSGDCCGNCLPCFI